MTKTVTYNIYPTPTANAFDVIAAVFGSQETQVSVSPFGRDLYDYTTDKPHYNVDIVERVEVVFGALGFADEELYYISGLLQNKPQFVSLITREDDYGVFHQLNIQP